MTRDEAKNDRVFLAMITRLAGSEGDIEKLHPSTIDILADAFATGFEYERSELPGEGQVILVTPEPVEGDVVPADEYRVMITEDIGPWRLFAGATEADCRQCFVAINPITLESKTFYFDAERDEREPWQDDDAEKWRGA